MKTQDLLVDLNGGRAALPNEGDRVRFRAPAGAFGAEERTSISARRAETIDGLRTQAASHCEVHPLSFTQGALWFIHQQAPGSAAYNLPLPVRLLGPMNAIALAVAAQALVDRHAILRTTYALDGDRPTQRVLGAAAADFACLECGGLDVAALKARVEVDAVTPFDLARGPVMRVRLYRVSPDEHILLLVAHHIAADELSLMTLVGEMLQLYAEAAGGTPSKLAPPTVDYVAYTSWQKEMLGGPEGERLWSYWRKALASPPPPLELPLDRDRGHGQSSAGASVPLALDAELSQALKHFALQEKTTVFVVWLACFQAFLFRLTGAQDLIVGSPTLGRSRPEFYPVIGDFVNSIPLRGRPEAGLPFVGFVAQLRDAVLGALDAQEFPLGLMVQRLRSDRHSGGSALFNTFFLLQSFERHAEFPSPIEADRSYAGLRLAPYALKQTTAQFELSAQMVEVGDDVRGNFLYSTALFDTATAESLAEDFVRVVRALAANPQLRLGDLPLPARSRPMAVGSLLAKLRARGVHLLLEEGKLRVNAPRGALDEPLKAELSRRRLEIIAALAAGAPSGRVLTRLPPVRLANITAPFPVSAVQRRMWFLDRMEPNSVEYVIGGGLRMSGPLDLARLQAALQVLTDRHESLRTRIRTHNGAPEPEILSDVRVSVTIEDLREVAAEAREGAIRALTSASLCRPFDFGTAPLCRFLIVRLGENEHILAVAMHHIIADGWSLAIATREIREIYDAASEGRQPNLPPLDLRYVDYAAWENAQLGSGLEQDSLSFWEQALANAPVALDLPTDRPRSATRERRGARLRRFLGADLVTAVTRLGRERQATPFMVLMSAWQVMLHRQSGQEDILVGTAVANRDTPALEDVIGCFVNNVVIRGKLNDETTFAAFLDEIRTSTVAAFDHRELPFDKVIECLNPDRGSAQSPLFQVLFTLMSFPLRIAGMKGVSVEPIEIDTHAARFDLAVELMPFDAGSHAGEMLVLYEYSTGLFDEVTIHRMHDRFVRILESVVVDPRIRVADIDLLTQDEATLLLEAWQGAPVAAEPPPCAHDALARLAACAADAIAVVSGAAALTYGSLERASNRLARLLRVRGVGSGDRVAILLERTLDLPVAMAAVLKTGAAYVPIDPAYPVDRVRYVLEDCQAAAVVTQRAFRDLTDDAVCGRVVLEDVVAELALEDDGPLHVPVQPDDAAYVLYTSGSTGRPKGVVVEHRNLAAFLQAMRVKPGLAATDTLLSVTTPSFDIFGLEIWLPLSVGARIILADRLDVTDGSRLSALIETHAVTVLQATPATWQLLIEAGWTGRPGFRALCGGEALSRGLAAALLARVGELWNLYGPTETTIWSTVDRVADADAITIGRPIAGTRAHVLDPAGRLQPIGVPGELCIAGDGVARGYFARPELTAERFGTFVSNSGTSERIYRTGDIVRRRNDGRIDYLGRRDHQVKIRGYRIELGEIEAVLAGHAGVRQCVVAARGEATGGHKLVAYVVPQPGASFDEAAARASLGAKLPDYMLPQAFVTLDALPLTGNGKIDRARLPDPRVQTAEIRDISEALMTPVQKRIAGIWKTLLERTRIGLHDKFFDAGGHSLLLVRLHAALQRAFDTEFPLLELFQSATIAAQAERFGAATRTENHALRRAQARAARQADD